MADIFQEVEEGLREDRFRKLFRRYGPIGAAAVAAIVLGVAGREAWSSWTEARAERSSKDYMAALTALQESGPDAAAGPLSRVADDGYGAYPALAKQLEGAGIAGLDPAGLNAPLGAEERARAVELFEEAARASHDPLLRDAATLKAAYLLADTISLDELEGRLEDAMERGAPYELAARELFGAAALQAGELDRAREAYSYLTISLEAPGGVRRRAEEALAVIEAALAAGAADNEEG